MAHVLPNPRYEGPVVAATPLLQQFSNAAGPVDQTALAVFFTLSNLPNKEVGARVRAWRGLANLSQRELAERASVFLPDGERLTQVDISRFENSPGSVRFFVVAAVCRALSKQISDLLEEVPVAIEDPA